MCRNLSPSTIHINLSSPAQLDTYIDPRDGTTSKASISYRNILDILRENLFHNATSHDKTFPTDLPRLRPSVDQGFHSLEDNVFEREHYSAHYVNPLPDNATPNIHIQNNNALIFWLCNIHTIVNDIGTLNTSNTPLDHGERNLVNTIKNIDTQLNQLSVCTHETITPLLAFQPDRVNNKGEPLMTDLIASHLGPIKQDIRNAKKQFKPDPPPNAPIRTSVTP